MSLARNVFSNTLVQIVGKLLTAAIAIVTIKILTNYLGKEGYGFYTSVYEILSLAAIFADLGMFQLAVREMARDPKNEARILGVTLTLRIVLTIVLMLVAAALVWIVPQYTGTVIPLGVSIGTTFVFLNLMSGTLTSVIQLRLKMQMAVIWQVLGKLISLLYMVYAVYYLLPDDPERGFYHLIVAGSVGMVFTVIGVWYAARSLTSVRLMWDTALLKSLLWKTLPYGAATILATIYFRMDTILLGLLLPRATAQHDVGLYGVAVRIVENIQMVPGFFLNSVLAAFTAFIATDLIKFRKAFQFSFDALVLMALPLWIGGWILAYPLISLVSAPEFLSTLTSPGSDTAFRLLLVALTFSFVSGLMNFTLLAAGHQKDILLVNAIVVALKFVVTYFAISHFGFLGAGAVSACAEFLLCMLAGYFVWRRLHVLPSLLTFAKALLAALIMGGVLIAGEDLLRSLGNIPVLLILTPVGGLVYLALLFAFRAVTKDMIKMVLKKGG